MSDLNFVPKASSSKLRANADKFANGVNSASTSGKKMGLADDFSERQVGHLQPKEVFNGKGEPGGNVSSVTKEQSKEIREFYEELSNRTDFSFDVDGGRIL